MDIRPGRQLRGGTVTAIVGTILLFLPGCVVSATAEEREYRRLDRANEFREKYFATKSYCRSQGRGIVVETMQPERCSVAERRSNDGNCPPRPGDRILGCAI